MNNKLLKKFYILRLFTLCLPKKQNIRKNNFYLCKYIAKNTPYSNIYIFFKEIYKIFNVKKNLNHIKHFFFSCSHKIFIKTLKYIKNKKKIKNLTLHTKKKFEISNRKISFLIICSDNYTSRQISYIKDKKIFSIGFINYNNIAQLTDFVLLLENKYFTSIFFFKYVLKKLSAKWIL